jgi:hypothetical protein
MGLVALHSRIIEPAVWIELRFLREKASIGIHLSVVEQLELTVHSSLTE